MTIFRSELKKKQLSLAERALRNAVKVEMADRTTAIIQVPPVCHSCSLPIDIANPVVTVDFREVPIRDKTLIVAEPYCPTCGAKVAAEVSVVQ